MNPWWNLPFAVLVALGLWCRLGAPERVIDWLGRLLRYFGVADPSSERQAAADLLGIAGVTGLLFSGWADRLSVAHPAWLAMDAVATSLGVGLLGAWTLSRLGRERAETAQISRQMTMIEIDSVGRGDTVVDPGPPASDPG
jgi:hypothetical protein